jgi:hypothetical protein
MDCDTEHVCLQRLAAALEAEKLLKAGYTKQLLVLKISLQASVAFEPLSCSAYAGITVMALHQNLLLLSCRIVFNQFLSQAMMTRL